MVQAQQASPDNNVLNGAEFSPADDAAKIADTKNYLNRLSDKEKADMCREILQSAYSDDPNNAQMMQNMTDAQLSATLDRYVLGSGDTENERLLSIYDTYISSGSYLTGSQRNHYPLHIHLSEGSPVFPHRRAMLRIPCHP